MATAKRKGNRRNIVKAEVAILFTFLVGVGFVLGRFTAPKMVETVTKTVEVPYYTTNFPIAPRLPTMTFPSPTAYRTSSMRRALTREYQCRW